MSIQSHGHLSVQFQTQTDFYGMFVRTDGRRDSLVQSNDLSHVNFDLRLLQTEESFDNPTQLWQFNSDAAVSHLVIDLTSFHL